MVCMLLPVESALSTSTALANGTTYYASQTIGGCESDTRFAVAVTVSDPAAPTGTAAQSFCAINNPTVASLTATGTAIQWYAAASGGSLHYLHQLHWPTATSYYASQTTGGCESDTRLAVTVTVGDPPAPTGICSQSFCAINNPTVADLTATGTAIQWYTSPTGGPHYLHQLLGHGTSYLCQPDSWQAVRAIPVWL